MSSLHQVMFFLLSVMSNIKMSKADDNIEIFKKRTVPDSHHSTKLFSREYLMKLISGELKEVLVELNDSKARTKLKDDELDTSSAEGQLLLFAWEDEEAKVVDDLSEVILAAENKIIHDTNLTVSELQMSDIYKSVWKDVLKKYCMPHTPTYECNKEARYRTYDGSCNNIHNPDWGKSFTAQERYMAARYENDIDSPRTIAKDGSPLPNVRLISNIIFRSNVNHSVHDPTLSVLAMAWGQFMVHDIVKTPLSKGKLQCCNDGNKSSECMEINIPNDDPFFKSQKCMNFIRSAPAISSSCIPGRREQLNSVTSYIDASNVYGSTTKEAIALREMQEGRLKVLPGNLPPRWSEKKCRIKDADSGTYCMHAGDGRVNVVPNLAALHIVFVREHNRLVSKLAKLNTTWRTNDEILFQTARKIIGAYMQHFTYEEYLPILLNYNLTKRLKSLSGLHKNRYRAETNPGVWNVFAAAAFRFGHSQIPDHQGFLDKNVKDVDLQKEVPLEESFHDPAWLQYGHCKKPCPQITNWMTIDTSYVSDRIFDSGVRDKLFLDKKGHSFDLPALNTQRGRDHGIPSYTAWLRRLGRHKVTSFNTKDKYGLRYHTKEAAALLQKAYKHVDDIDLYVGAMSEVHLPGASVGPTFFQLISRQFMALKEGDRFWYENRNGPMGFTHDQIKAIKKVKLAKILCENMELQSIQPNVMNIPMTKRNKLRKCSDLDDLDVQKWENEA